MHLSKCTWIGIPLLLLSQICMAEDLRSLPMAPRPQIVRPGVSNSPDATVYAVDGTQKSLEELNLIRAQNQKIYGAMNVQNPLSADFDSGKVAASMGVNGLPANLQKLLQNPTVQAYSRLIMDPKFQNNVQLVALSPARLTLLFAELAWIIFMFVFRTWRFSTCDVWYHRIWTSVWTGGLFFIVGSLALPFTIIGDPYMKMVSSILEVIF